MSHHPTQNQSALSIHQVAEEWGMKYDAVYDLIQSGRLIAFKAGRHWRIKRSAIASYEKAHSNVTPTKGAAA